MADSEKRRLSDEEADFFISSFKNKERRNNPSTATKPLLSKAAGKKEPLNEAETKSEINSKTSNTPKDPGRKRSKSSDYESTFLTETDIPMRKGKLVGIREKYHKRISRLVNALDKKDVSIFSYIDNILTHHFETYRSEISDVYNSNNNDDEYLNPQ